MVLIGANSDSSGFYRMFLNGDLLITMIGSSPEGLEESGRQRLVPAPDFIAPSEDSWYNYGTEGHICDIDEYGEYARIDGSTYALNQV